MRLRLMVPLLALPLALSACGAVSDLFACRDGYSRPDAGTLAQTLHAARLRWQATGLQNYSYEFSQFAAPVGFPVVRVTVRAGNVVKVEQVGTGTTPPSSDAGRTVDERFADIASDIGSVSQVECGELAVSYDATDGHPLTLSAGVARKNLADGDGAWTISNFTRL